MNCEKWPVSPLLPLKNYREKWTVSLFFKRGKKGTLTIHFGTGDTVSQIRQTPLLIDFMNS